MRAVVVGLFPSLAQACPGCRPAAYAAIWNDDFAFHLVVLVVPLLILAGLAVAFYFSDRWMRVR